MELKEITQFRKRFGDKIPDNVLTLFLEDEDYRYAINHKIGRELISEILYTMNILINLIADGDKKCIAELGEYRKIASKWSNIIRNGEKKEESFYEKEVFSEDVKKRLEKCCGKRWVEESSKVLFSLDRFYHAYRSDIGKKIIEDIKENIDGGARIIWEGKSNGELLNYKAYKVLNSYWNDKIKSHKKISDETIILINRRFK